MIGAQKLQYCLVGMMAAGSVAALAAIFLTSTTRVVGPSEPGLQSPARIEVEKLLRSYQRAWHPSDREQIVEAGRPEADRYAPVLRYILLRPWHELAGPAVEMAASWGVTEAVPELAGLTAKGPKELRPAALAAADRLQPWPMERLLEFAQDPETGVQVAAFEALFARDDAPWREVMALLVDAAPAVRDAAVAVLPDELPEEAVAALEYQCERLEPERVVGLLQALGKGLENERTERLMMRLLGEFDPQIVSAALDALATKPSPLLDPESVWRIAEDSTRGDHLRTRAMRCLEQTGSFDPQKVREAYGLPPLARYFAARCLLRAGDPAGVEALIGIVESAPSLDGAPDDVPADAVAAAQASRRLLSWLTGVRPGAPTQEFQDWLNQAGDSVGAEHLPAAPF